VPVITTDVSVVSQLVSCLSVHEQLCFCGIQKTSSDSTFCLFKLSKTEKIITGVTLSIGYCIISSTDFLIFTHGFLITKHVRACRHGILAPG